MPPETAQEEAPRRPQFWFVIQIRPRCPECHGRMELIRTAQGTAWFCDACWEWVEAKSGIPPP